MKKALLPFLLVPVLGAQTAQAQVDLIANGKVDGSYQDFSTRTAGAMESGVAGNSLGGIGSGLAYAGGNTFFAIPDRGPNATPYASAVDDTTSYVTRFQTFELSLAKNPSYDPLTVGSLPYILSPFLTDTTLLSSKDALVYGAGGQLLNDVTKQLPSGVPSINKKKRSYFTGRSDNFDATKTSTNSLNGRLDPEGIRVSNDGASVFITDEYGPYVYQFDRFTGLRTNVFSLPAYYAVANLNSLGATEISGNTSGRIANKGMEALAITPDGKTLVGMMQQNLIQDTVKSGGKKVLRIITIDIATGATHEYGYSLTDGSSVSDILAINDHEFLVDERDGSGLGNGDAAVVKKLYKIDLTGATDISGVTALTSLTGKTLVAKTLFMDVLAILNANGITSDKIPAKLEGVAFGPDMVINGVTKHTMFIANDNDFLPTATLPAVGGVPGATVSNPNQFFVFSIDTTDLPTLVPQVISKPFGRDQHDRG